MASEAERGLITPPIFKKIHMKINNCLDRPDDTLDPRQYLLGDVQSPEDKTPEEFMDIMPKMSNVGRQIFGTCTAWASTKGIKEFQEQELLSHYFIYVMSKRISGNYNSEGEYLVNPLKAICEYGVPREEFMPDTKPASGKWIDYVSVEPDKLAFENAKNYKGKTYWSVGNSIENVKNAIYKNYTPVIFAMKWYRSYNSIPASGILPDPDVLVGYHAVCAVGWDKDGLLVKNSFGKNWGKEGYFKILFNKWDVVQPYAFYVLLDLICKNNNMRYVKSDIGEQYLLDDRLMIGLNIGDESELIVLIARGLNEAPAPITDEQLCEYEIYPLVRKSKFRDLLGF